MRKLFLMEEFFNRKWLPHSRWAKQEFQTVLSFLKNKPEELRNRRRIRRIKTRAEAEQLHMECPNLACNSGLENIRWES